METTICSFSFRIKTFGCCCCCCWILLLPMSFPGCLSTSLFLLLSEWLLPPLFPSQWRTCRSERPLGCHCSSFSPSCFCYRSKTRTRTVLAIRHVSWPKLSGGGHLGHSIPPPRLFLSLLSPFLPLLIPFRRHPPIFPVCSGKSTTVQIDFCPRRVRPFCPLYFFFLSFFPETKIIASTVTVSSGYFLSGQAAPVCPSRSYFTAAPLAFYCQSVLFP